MLQFKVIQTYIIGLFISITSYLSSQVLPITTSNLDGYTIYKANGYDSDLLAIESQSDEAVLNIYESNTTARYREGVGFTTNFFKQAFTTSTYSTLIKNRSRNSRFSFIYNIDENGNVLSCALKMKSNLASLDDSELQPLLEAAMNHKFIFVKRPSYLTSFKFPVTVDYAL